MRKSKEIVFWVVFGLMVLVTVLPLIYWGFHPEMTEMQVFLKFWWVYLFTILLYIPLKKSL